MMKSRGAAVIGAFVLIALAIFVRGLLVGDDGGSDGPKQNGDGGRPVIACTPELIEVCDALAAEGEIAGNPPTLDLDEADTPTADIDGWITWDPAPQIANFTASQSQVWGTPEALGSATLAALIAPDTATALRGCNAKTVWSCVADAASLDLTVGVGDPATAEGLARLSPLAQALSSGLDPDSLDANELRDIVETIPQDTAAEMALEATQPGRVSIVVGPEAVLGQVATTQQGKTRKLSVAVVTPETAATIVLAPRVGHDLGDLADACEDDDVAKALADAGVEPCTGTVDDALAGFLFQVQKKVG